MLTVSYTESNLQLTASAQSPGACYIRWGDGTSEKMDVTQAPTDSVAGQFTKAHTYAKAGVYEVEARDNDVHQTRRFIMGNPYPASKYPAELARQEAAADELAGYGAMTSRLG